MTYRGMHGFRHGDGPQPYRALHLLIALLLSSRSRKAWMFYQRCRMRTIMLHRARRKAFKMGER